MQFIDLKAQQKRIEHKINAAITRVLDHGQYVMGPEVAELEERLISFSGAKHALTCANGTDALILALRAYGIGPGDAVFAPSFTFVATVEAVKLVGATPVFCDVDGSTFNICTDSLEKAIDYVQTNTDLAPKAVIAVDLFGQPADYVSLRKIAEDQNLKLIADAAQSFGASQNDQKVGILAHITTTSFFPAKPLGCYGDGGALFTEDPEIESVIRSIRNHGMGTDRYDNIRIGTNSRLDTLQAAILLEKLNIFSDEIIARELVASRYEERLPKNLTSQTRLNNTTSVWAQYTVVCENRDKIRDELNRRGIPTAVYYPKPNHLQAPYINDPCSPTGLANTQYLQDRVISLPMHPYLDEKNQDSIIAAIADIVA